MFETGFPKILISGNINLFQNNYNSAGVYAFSGLIHTQSFQTPIYVGSAVDMRRRLINEHIPDLEDNIHTNSPLQNYFNKYKIENIVVWQLESTQPIREQLLLEEQKYIDFYGIAADKKAFNIYPTAGSPLGYKHSEEVRKKLSELGKGRKHSEKTIKKMSEIAKKRTPELKKRAADARRGKGPKRGHKHTPEHIAKMSKPFRLIDPSGNIIEGTNLAKFARENNLTGTNLSRVMTGKSKSCKGYRKAPENEQT